MSYPTRYAATTRGPYTGLREGFEALMRKKDATLTGGAYAREPHPGVTTSCAPANRSIWATTDGLAVGSTALGMGMVQGLLAILTGVVQSIAWERTTLYGQVRIAGVSSSETYTMSFDDTRSDYLLLGGFVNGPAYQAAIMGVVIRWIQRDTNVAGSRELLHAWWQLVAALDERYPRGSGRGAWSREQVKSACQPLPENARVRAALERTADALCFALKHPLPTLTGRALFVQYDTALREGVVLEGGEYGTVLLTLPPDHPGVSGPAPAPAGRVEDHDSDLELDTPESEPAMLPSPPTAGRRTSRPAPAAAGHTSAVQPVEPPVPAGDELPVAPPLIGAALQARIERAFTRPGDVFLFGVTATGKTSWAKHAALSHGFGLEIVVFKPGLKDEMLYGSLVQRDGGWCWQDGPIVRAARRAVAGEAVVLLLDELPRGDKSIVAGTMELLNTYTAADLVAQCLSVPALPGPYRVVRISDTQETLVIAVSYLKVIATANLGDRYGGLDLADPAFRRRWNGGWIELAGYTETETAAILAGHLALPARHPLIVALIKVDAEVQAYQRKEDALVMTTNLAILLNWGQEVLRQLTPQNEQNFRLPGTATPSPAVDSTQAFITAAKDLWIDMICPLAGDRRDPDVYRAILSLTERHAPGRF